MQSALTVEEIERLTREKFDTNKSIILIFSPYNGEENGPNFDFLRRVTDYHFHSGQGLDCYCVGYSLYEPEPNRQMGRSVRLSDDFGWPLTYFYPENFHQIRTFVQRKLNGRWRYNGGVDAILFSASGDDLAPVNWHRAACVSSRVHVNNAFQDVDHMLRTIMNLNEEFDGGILPEQLDPEIARRRLIEGAKRLAGEAAGAAISGAITLIG